MMEVLYGLVVAYGFLCVILMLVLTRAVLRWQIKGLLISASSGFFVLSFVVLVGLLGFPNPNDPPEKFMYLWSDVYEPTPTREGVIYVWVREMDSLKDGPPRVYTMEYTKQLHREFERIKKKQRKSGHNGRFAELFVKRDKNTTTYEVNDITGKMRLLPRKEDGR